MKKYLILILVVIAVVFANISLYFYHKDQAANKIEIIKGVVTGKLTSLINRGESSYHVFLKDQNGIDRDIVVTPLTYFRAEVGKEMIFNLDQIALENYRGQYETLMILSGLVSLMCMAVFGGIKFLEI